MEKQAYIDLKKRLPELLAAKERLLERKRAEEQKKDQQLRTAVEMQDVNNAFRSLSAEVKTVKLLQTFFEKIYPEYLGKVIDKVGHMIEEEKEIPDIGVIIFKRGDKDFNYSYENDAFSLIDNLVVYVGNGVYLDFIDGFMRKYCENDTFKPRKGMKYFLSNDIEKLIAAGVYVLNDLEEEKKYFLSNDIEKLIAAGVDALNDLEEEMKFLQEEASVMGVTIDDLINFEDASYVSMKDTSYVDPDTGYVRGVSYATGEPIEDHRPKPKR